MSIEEIVAKQKRFFQTGKTKDISFRIKALTMLKEAIKKQENNIYEALEKDLGKSTFETYMSEIGMVYSELTDAIKHVKTWSKPKKQPTPMSQFYASSYIVPEPYGVTLIMAPWNYPFMLSIDPLIASISAGNCCILKPSEYAPNTSHRLAKLLQECFSEEYVAVVEGGIEESSKLLEQEVDYIFFTGGTKIGQIVMEHAAKKLIPVTLELGGKSPCIIEETANLPLSAKRLVFGKILNAGQTCVAPDYVLLQQSVKEEFIGYLKQYIKEFLGEEPLKNKDFPHIINQKHWERLQQYLQNQTILYGGKVDKETRKIEPTLIDNPSRTSSVMQEEIFGPILPIITFEKIEEAINYVVQGEKPLALYLFTTNKKIEQKILKEISFGGGCINDTIMHLATSKLPFGGVGQSGIGQYHGKFGFDTFSHPKSILKKANWIDMPMRYHPYTKRKLKIVKLFLK